MDTPIMGLLFHDALYWILKANLAQVWQLVYGVQVC